MVKNNVSSRHIGTQDGYQEMHKIYFGFIEFIDQENMGIANTINVLSLLRAEIWFGKVTIAAILKNGRHF